MSTNFRRNFVMKSRLCFNCLNFGHQVSSCYFPPCPRCGEKHNSKLHEEQANTSNEDASIANDDNRSEPHVTAMYTEMSAPEAENRNVLCHCQCMRHFWVHAFMPSCPGLWFSIKLYYKFLC
ncbi:unnamed protein product [Macrosiphum euphorbiae]|nr:unnamed protein product [Macrosiphum euphorbiae]